MNWGFFVLTIAVGAVLSSLFYYVTEESYYVGGFFAFVAIAIIGGFLI